MQLPLCLLTQPLSFALAHMQHGVAERLRVWGAACNLHTALALVAKMRGLGIHARCDKLVMQPTLAMQRRKQRRFQQQARLALKTKQFHKT